MRALARAIGAPAEGGDAGAVRAGYTVGGMGKRECGGGGKLKSRLRGGTIDVGLGIVERGAVVWVCHAWGLGGGEDGASIGGYVAL